MLSTRHIILAGAIDAHVAAASHALFREAALVIGTGIFVLDASASRMQYGNENAERNEDRAHDLRDHMHLTDIHPRRQHASWQ
jgi:hypothetical protein